MIRVLLVDDHASFRTNLQHMLESTGDIQVVATAASGVEAIAHAAVQCPDVAIIDISMPFMDGIEAARQIQIVCRATRVMMLSILDQPEYVQRSLDVGAIGYVLKDEIGSDLLSAIHDLHIGKRYFSRKVAEIADKYFGRGDNNSWAG